MFRAAILAVSIVGLIAADICAEVTIDPDKGVLGSTAEKRAWINDAMVKELGKGRQLQVMQHQLGKMDAKQIDVLANQPVLTLPEGETLSEKRGRTFFNPDRQCGQCHSGPMLNRTSKFHPNGVGLAYSIHPNHCMFCITALREHDWPERLSHLLEEALLEMQTLNDLEKPPASKL